MKWNEFKAFLSGLDPETPLGRVVMIRAETDKEVLKNFTKEQQRIRNEWRRRLTENKTQEQLEDALEAFKQAFMEIAGN